MFKYYGIKSKRNPIDIQNECNSTNNWGEKIKKIDNNLILIQI